MKAHLFYGLWWLSFAIAHSLLATPKGRNFLTRLFGPAERIAYNIMASLHIALVFAAGRLIFTNDLNIPTIQPDYKFLMIGVGVFGWLLMFLALKEYDLGRFSGLTQWRMAKQGNQDDQLEPLQTQGFHKFVRHPIYLSAYLILWSGAFNTVGLDTAIWGSIYLFIGMRFEERKLHKIYGRSYQIYCQQVPAFIPWKGRVETINQ